MRRNVISSFASSDYSIFSFASAKFDLCLWMETLNWILSQERVDQTQCQSCDESKKWIWNRDNFQLIKMSIITNDHIYRMVIVEVQQYLTKPNHCIWPIRTHYTFVSTNEQFAPDEDDLAMVQQPSTITILYIWSLPIVFTALHTDQASHQGLARVWWMISSVWDKISILNNVSTLRCFLSEHLLETWWVRELKKIFLKLSFKYFNFTCSKCQWISCQAQVKLQPSPCWCSRCWRQCC